MRALIWKGNRGKRTTDLSDVRAIKSDPDAYVWIDLCSPRAAELRELQKMFGFHDLAIADCLDDTTNRPRIADHQDHCFIIFQSIQKMEDDEVTVGELDVFLGARFLVTSHPLSCESLDRVWDDALNHDGLMSKGPDFVLYSIVARLTDLYFTMLETLDEEVDRLEDSIVSDSSQEVLNEIFRLKHRLIHLRRIAGPQREVFAMLNHREFPYVDQETLIYFRDVYEHLIRIYEMIDSLRDLISGALEAYLSTVSNRLNSVMKTLTVMATIFMPLTLISSIYGMNFKYMPELSWRYGYAGCVAFMALLSAWMIAYFRRKKWL